MKVAFGHLRYTPDTFWSMSMREWRLAWAGYASKMGIPEKGEILQGNDLSDLMERYPDDRKTA